MLTQIYVTAASVLLASIIVFPILGTYFGWLISDLTNRYDSTFMVWFWLFFCVGSAYTGTILYIIMRPEGDK